MIARVSYDVLCVDGKATLPSGMITKSMSYCRDETNLITHTGGPDFLGVCYYICLMAMKAMNIKRVKLKRAMQWGCTMQPTGDPMQETCIAGDVQHILAHILDGRMGECMQPTGDPMQETCIAGDVQHILAHICDGRMGECMNECQGSMTRKQMMQVQKMLRDPDICCMKPTCQQVKPMARHYAAKFGRGTYVCRNGIGAYLCAECQYDPGILSPMAYSH
jgi:hypothetical protein